MSQNLSSAVVIGALRVNILLLGTPHRYLNFCIQTSVNKGHLNLLESEVMKESVYDTSPKDTMPNKSFCLSHFPRDSIL